jgi:DNA-directed RNA polymerase subunit RPC12/RpoP
MDIIFNCPNCDQELAVDQSGAGSQIDCPNCNEHLIIPAGGKVTTGALPPVPEPHAMAASPIAASAAAKVPLHLKVPVRDKPSESLIDKPKPPLEIVQKGAGKRLRIHTIRRASCIESGHDKFDEKVTAFLQEVTETNLIGIHTISYEMFDVGVQKIMTDYGVLIVYRG